ncbi:MAG: GMC family oxidoreductase [Acidobacteria bacterium]|nr:GMC family oxidoreductase [Acidobacteriota bacterium]
MSLKHVNAVIVGAGAAGGVVARQLASAGIGVVLFERGGWPSNAGCRKDDLRNQRTSVLGHPFGPDDERNPRVVVENNGQTRIVRPSEGGYQNNAACVGSGTVSYGAMAWRFMPQDFKMRSTYGAMPGSTLDDWPISYDDLEPHYERAEWELGVSGDVAPDPFKGPRKKPLPMPPLPGNKECELLRAAARRLGWHPFDVPMARNSVPFQGRQACMRCRWCVGFACEVNAKNGTHNTVIPAALATGHCELRTGCMVKEILIDARGHPRGVAYFDADDRLQEQTADIVVVSSAAIESARLLLNSKSGFHPHGLGNRYDWVGRNLQGHSYVRSAGLFDFEVQDDIGPGSGVALCDFAHGNPGLTGGAMLTTEFLRSPYQFVEKTPPGVPRWGLEHKLWMRRAYLRHASAGGPIEELPTWDSRVEVDRQAKDYWGIPVARLSGQKHPHVIEVAKFVAAKCDVWMKEAGAIKTWPSIPNRALSGGQHQAGTCRMGNDPKTSVVNRHCQVHDVGNLFVIDGSVHVTNGCFNPVLTIMAVAYWASDYIVKEWKGSKFRG